MTARQVNTLLDPNAVDRLVKLCGMLGSDFDGERAKAAAKADALVRSQGLTWSDVIVRPKAPPPAGIPWHRMASFCRARPWLLSPREREFVQSILTWRGQPTEKQMEWLVDLYARLHSGAGR